MIRPTHLEIDLDAIAANLRGVQARVGPGVKVLAAVKADGYGHGIVEAAKVAVEVGTEMVGVAVVEEGVRLRNAGIDLPVLVLGVSLPEQAATIVQYRLTQTVCTIDLAAALADRAAAAGQAVPVHVKVDTGMGRLGLPVEDVVPFIRQLAAYRSLAVEGVFTHFSTADDADKRFTVEQTHRFRQLLVDLDRQGLRPAIAHAANSGAILDLPESYFDMVRPGLIVYGYYPVGGVSRSLPLQPAMTWKTRIVYLKRVPAGTGLSYGRTYVTPQDTVIATLPVGYEDGYSRALSNRGVVLVRGQRAPVVGRVCMDQCLIDVGHIPGVSIGDEVVLVGRQGTDEVSIYELARRLGTIPNEAVCLIGTRVPRLFLRGGRVVGVREW
ncbi:MAG: alanine racemase [Candidatus Latescibacteria bacterium]|nr:alanine racemase [Candidatus Latescibacterota bacterium]